MSKEKLCFACDRPLIGTLVHSAVNEFGGVVNAITEDGAQTVSVGPDCWQRIASSGETGYQPPRGGPRLLTLTARLCGGCAVREPWEHRCFGDGSGCLCLECREIERNAAKGDD
jgi:hypothetical protein